MAVLAALPLLVVGMAGMPFLIVLVRNLALFLAGMVMAGLRVVVMVAVVVSRVLIVGSLVRRFARFWRGSDGLAGRFANRGFRCAFVAVDRDVKRSQTLVSLASSMRVRSNSMRTTPPGETSASMTPPKPGAVQRAAGQIARAWAG